MTNSIAATGATARRNSSEAAVTSPGVASPVRASRTPMARTAASPTASVMFSRPNSRFWTIRVRMAHRAVCQVASRTCAD